MQYAKKCGVERDADSSPVAAVVLLLLLVLVHIERLLDSSSVVGARSPLLLLLRGPCLQAGNCDCEWFRNRHHQE